MKGRTCLWRLALLGVSGALWSAAVNPQQRAIDPRTSIIMVRVYKAGVFSAFAHDHEIAAPIAAGQVDTAARSVQFHIDTNTLKVRDPKASEEDRNEIRKTMLAPAVLDAGQNPQIVFRSTAAEPSGPNSWTVRGSLTLHGQTRPVNLEVSERDGHYVGHALLKQTEFGIKPVRLAGGTVRVKDEVRIEFDIQLTH